MNNPLLNLLSFLRRLIEPSDTITDPIQRQQIRLLNLIIVVFVPIAALTGVVQTIVDPINVGLSVPTGVIVVFFAVVLLTCAYFAGRYFGYQWAVSIIIVTGYIIIVFNATTDIDYHVDIAYILLLSVMASMIVPIRTLILLAIIETVTAVIYFVIVAPETFIDVKITSLIVVGNILIILTSYYRSLLERDRYQRMKDSESFLQTITRQLPVSVWITDKQLKRRATFGRMPVDTPLDTIPDRKSIQAYQTALAGQSMQFEARQGDHFYQYHIEPMRDEEDAIVGTLGVATDITEQKHAQEQALELDLERERVEMLSTFIEYSSHDLRTPISNINTYLYLLSNSVKSEKEQGYIQIIREQSTRLHNLIENMLMLQRLELGKVDDFREISLKSLLDEIEITCHPRVENAGITFEYALEDKHVILNIDPQQISVALVKIIDNAIQYTEAGGIIRLGCDYHKDTVSIVITDTGLGIAEEHLPHIFDMFYRGDTSRSAATGDNGLGLTIAKRIINAHRGEICVESKVNAGTTVSITLPALYV